MQEAIGIAVIKARRQQLVHLLLYNLYAIVCLEF